MVMNCECGMDLEALPSGNSRDHAICLNCTWEAAGTFAEHAGTHHFHETGHRWHLDVFSP